MRKLIGLVCVSSFALVAWAGPVQDYVWTGAVDIPDNNPAGMELMLDVPSDPDGFNTIDDLNFDLIIRHTWQGDLIMRLTSPMGTMITLIDRPGVPEVSTVGFSADNYGDPAANTPMWLDDEAAMIYDVPGVANPGIANVTGSWIPENLLSAFDGESNVGTWTFFVSDNASLDTGAVAQWSLHFTNVPEPTSLGLLALGALALVRRR